MADQSDAGSAGKFSSRSPARPRIFSQWTNQTQEARVYSHPDPRRGLVALEERDQIAHDEDVAHVEDAQQNLVDGGDLVAAGSAQKQPIHGVDGAADGQRRKRLRQKVHLRKGKENIPVVGTNHGRGERIHP
eukprot:7018560-Pyramimonas_sp.AAC.2